MVISVTHAKTINTTKNPDIVQADVDALIADGKLAATTLVSEIALGSDFNSNHTVTGTKADFDTACSDGNFVYVGDVVGTSAATASTTMARDSDANTNINNINQGYLSTATSGGTLALTKASPYFLRFTGATTHTVLLPDCTTIPIGTAYSINNVSTGAVTVNKNDGSALWIIAQNTSVIVTCQNVASAAGGWNKNYNGVVQATGTGLISNNSLTFNGTDGSTVTFGTGGTVLYNGGALGTPSSGTLTNCTGLPESGVTNLVADLAAKQPLDTQLTSLAALSYSGNALKVVRVNAGETDFELAAASGTGTVTSVSVTTANGVSGSVATATTTPAISLTLGDITPSSVAIGTLGYSPAANTCKLSYADTQNTYINPVIQNKSNGAAASSDLSLNTDAGTDSAQYANFGINGTGWSSTNYELAKDAYLINEGGASGVGNLLIGTSQANTKVKFSVGNGFLNATSGILELTSSQARVYGVLEATSLGGNIQGAILAIHNGMAMP